jgi:hypothetical protein
MTDEEVTARIAERPELCQMWECAEPIEDDAGVLYLSSIHRGEEVVGTVHVYIWGKEAKGNPLLGRQAALRLMKENGLDRLLGEIPCTNHLALNWAKRVGFHTIGVVRQRKDAHGTPHDVVLMDALPEDLAWE